LRFYLSENCCLASDLPKPLLAKEGHEKPPVSQIPPWREEEEVLWRGHKSKILNILSTAPHNKGVYIYKCDGYHFAFSPLIILFLSPSCEGGVRGGLFCPHPTSPLVPQSGIYDRGGLLKWRIEDKRITTPFILWRRT